MKITFLSFHGHLSTALCHRLMIHTTTDHNDDDDDASDDSLQNKYSHKTNYNKLVSFDNQLYRRLSLDFLIPSVRRHSYASLHYCPHHEEQDKQTNPIPFFQQQDKEFSISSLSNFLFISNSLSSMICLFRVCLLLLIFMCKICPFFMIFCLFVTPQSSVLVS